MSPCCRCFSLLVCILYTVFCLCTAPVLPWLPWTDTITVLVTVLPLAYNHFRPLSQVRQHALNILLAPAMPQGGSSVYVQEKGDECSTLHIFGSCVTLKLLSSLHAEVTKENVSWVCGHLSAARTCNTDGCWQNTLWSFWVAMTELGMCTIKILMKEEEKASNGILPWTVLHVHSAKVLLTELEQLIFLLLFLGCTEPDSFSVFDLPCHFLPVLVK